MTAAAFTESSFLLNNYKVLKVLLSVMALIIVVGLDSVVLCLLEADTNSPASSNLASDIELIVLRLLIITLLVILHLILSTRCLF